MLWVAQNADGYQHLFDRKPVRNRRLGEWEPSSIEGCEVLVPKWEQMEDISFETKPLRVTLVLA